MKGKIKKKLKDVQWRLKNLYWRVYGATVKNPRVPSNPKSLLFVCKGNICRSPFAERLAARTANKNGYGRLNFNSAGLEGAQPLSPPENAILCAASFGVPLGDHRSRKINDELIKSVDMVLVMEPWHLKTLKKSFSHIQSKLFLFSLFDKEKSIMNESYYRYHIPDPYGQPLDQFQMCYRRIERCILELFAELSRS